MDEKTRILKMKYQMYHKKDNRKIGRLFPTLKQAEEHREKFIKSLSKDMYSEDVRLKINGLLNTSTSKHEWRLRRLLGIKRVK